MARDAFPQCAKLKSHRQHKVSFLLPAKKFGGSCSCWRPVGSMPYIGIMGEKVQPSPNLEA